MSVCLQAVKVPGGLSETQLPTIHTAGSGHSTFASKWQLLDKEKLGQGQVCVTC